MKVDTNILSTAIKAISGCRHRPYYMNKLLDRNIQIKCEHEITLQYQNSRKTRSYNIFCQKFLSGKKAIER